MWIKPEYPKKRVGKAGEYLIGARKDKELLEESIIILNNWRSAHAFPLNSIQNSLRHRARKVDKDYLITQRLKRISSIENKLRRFPKMKLNRMQDIGGCRVILSNNSMVYKLKNDILRTNCFEMIKEDDYLKSPKESGYRGIHLIFQYCGRREEFKGLKIETQVRSKIQHYWATAVEIVGTFTNQQLKAGFGNEEWLIFFKLVSELLDDFENDKPKRTELAEEIKKMDEELRIIEKLKTYSVITNFTEQIEQETGRYLLQLDVNEQMIKINHFGKKELKKATEEYIKSEQKHQQDNLDIVLIEAKSIQELKKGYPNYFADSAAFIEYLSLLIGA